MKQEIPEDMGGRAAVCLACSHRCKSYGLFFYSRRSVMIEINIYWDDLSEEFKKKLLKVFGENCNWDCIPIANLLIEDEEEKRQIVLDSFLGDKGI